MHSLAVCLLVVSFIALCCGAPNYFNPLRRRAHHPFRKYPAEENAVAKRSYVAVDINACVKAHNEKRALHGAQPLTWDPTLAQHAQLWADHLAHDVGKMQHAGRPGEGENLYWSKRSSGSSDVATCEEAVEAWYSEEPYYPYNKPPHTNEEFRSAPKAYGHFTQVVWKSTKKVGVAISTKRDGGWTETFIVGRYSPPGNILGLFEQNVQ